MFTLDTVYEQYKNKQKSAAETINTIVRHMYLHPAYYQLDQISEDIRQDFMVFCHPHLYQILDNYDASRSSFATFFTYCFSMEKKRFFKEYYRKTSRQHAITEYLIEETSLDIAEAAESAHEITDCFSSSMTLDEITRTIPAFRRIRCLTPEQKLLIITLKSCYFITPEQVAQVARLTSTPVQTLNDMLCLVDRSLEKRIKRITRHNQRINQAYLTRKQLVQQLSMVSESGCLHQRLETSLKHQDEILQRFNSRTKAIPAITPSNKIVAEILQVSPTSVSHFLTLLHDKAGKNGILKP